MESLVRRRYMDYGSTATAIRSSSSFTSSYSMHTYSSYSSSFSSATTATCAVEHSRCQSETTLFNLYDVRLEIGSLVRQNKDEFFVNWEGPPTGLDFTVDPGNQKCSFCFSQSTPAFSSSDRRKRVRVCCDYKAEFLVRDITEFKLYKTIDMSLVILLRLASPPCIWKRGGGGGARNEFWNRTTDFSSTGAIGRSDFYKLTIPPEYSLEWNKFIDYLRQLRVKELDIIWPLGIEREPFFGTPSSDLFYSIGHKNGICFEVLFLVNAVLHKGVFNQYQLSEVFFDLLRSQPKSVNVAALNYLYSCSRGRPVLDACKRLRDVQEWFRANNPIASENNKTNKLDDVAYVRKLIITPTKAYCIPPEPQLPNRVLRNYKHVGDRFLRVTFMDEGMKTSFYNVLKSFEGKSCPQKETEVYQRVRSMLSDGFDLCGRRYSFLAFSSNQLRDRSAWFFAECKSITIHDVQTWMGKFTNRNVAKCSARMGQCFSSTRATVGVPSSKVKMVPDIERNGYNFSDGIGKIAPDLAMEVAKRLKLESDPPSAYQIRYAGFKGVIACWPSKEGETFQLSLRPSMKKFESNHTSLEICSWTRFQPGYLNRQIITLLSTLGVPDVVFWGMQQQMVTNLNRMLEDTDAAFDVLTSSCSEHGKSAAMMLRAGFKPPTEPHLRSMLTCIRASQLSGLREKSRIFVPSGRWLMGCLDELGALQKGQCFVQVSDPSLEKCCAKQGEKKLRRVIKGLVAVAKNPCLHPGDVRILEAVDAPGLHHLHDCLVFPQNGHRPHANEASGSDLDGDNYFVTWDENLIPPSKQSMKPMDFDTAKAKLLDRPVTNNDIIEFFVENMANESLGAICNAHVVHADLCEDGASDAKCIELAELAATAVDLPKTGEIVTMPQGLKPESYPDFMGKEDFKSYRSTKILGKLYRQITDDSMQISCDSGYGPYYDIDLEIPGAEKFIADAWELKCSYNMQLKSLMGQYNVTREVEVVTGHVWSMPKRISKKRGELQEQLKQSYTALKKEFRQCFERIRMNGGGNFESLSDDTKNSLYEQKASAWYIVTYRPDMVRRSITLQQQGPDDGPQEDEPLLRSFPWIVTEYLARIKIRRCGYLQAQAFGTCVLGLCIKLLLLASHLEQFAHVVLIMHKFKIRHHE